MHTVFTFDITLIPLADLRQLRINLNDPTSKIIASEPYRALRGLEEIADEFRRRGAT